MLLRLLLLPLLAVIAIPLAACSSFNRQFNTAKSLTPPANQPLAGTWEGTWQSDAGHGSGKLRAVITTTEVPSSATGTVPQKYEARFEATWAKVLKGRYTVPITATPAANSDRITFSGSKDLGFLYGGLYHYDGHVEGDHFHATYNSKSDHGTFTMTRSR